MNDFAGFPALLARVTIQTWTKVSELRRGSLKLRRESYGYRKFAVVRKDVRENCDDGSRVIFEEGGADIGNLFPAALPLHIRVLSKGIGAGDDERRQ